MVVDNSRRIPVFACFLVLTLLMLPVWWWSTSIPRAVPHIPAWLTPHRIGRLRRIELIVLDAAPEDEPWARLREPFLAFLPYYSDDQTVQFDDKIQIDSVQHLALPHQLNSFDQVAAHLPPGEERKLTVAVLARSLPPAAAAGSERLPQIWLHPERPLVICAGAREHQNYGEPQILLEELLATYYGRLARGQRKVPDSPQYLVTITLLVEQPPAGPEGGSSAVPTSFSSAPRWQIGEATRRFLLPIVEGLRGLADIDINYQVRPYVETLPPSLLRVVEASAPESRHFVIPSDQLPSFVNDTRWNVASTTSGATPIHLLILLPCLEHLPLRLEASSPLPADDDGNAYFAYRQWGGVAILNHRRDGSEATLTVDQLRPAMNYFAGLLRDFFGVHLGLANGDAKDTFAFATGPAAAKASAGMTASEGEGLLHRALHTRLSSTIGTLASLRRLLAKNSEIVVLPAVGTLVTHSLRALRMSESKLSHGEWEGALRAATEAMQWADRAFFHPTMMAHQYFPQEHKLGVYLPLFFPFVLPVLMASLSLSMAFFRARLRLALKSKAKSH